VEKKGLPHLIEAIALLRDAGRDIRCDLVGSGPERPRIESALQRARLQGVVNIVGSQPQEVLPAYYRRAAVFVMPAIVAQDGNRDALPTVLLEAMACGAPVVASRLTGIPEIVEDGVDGLLVEPRDVPALASAIARLLDDGSLSSSLGAAARAKAERAFDARQNAQDLARLFAGSVSQRAR
jgi:glycosyltransferase involved in cell wall biosynthesis